MGRELHIINLTYNTAHECACTRKCTYGTVLLQTHKFVLTYTFVLRLWNFIE